ncbi:hypothetical protein DESUT3_07240 [Desulfuromonas versatilis]|uniref:DUF4112 domain-containing protein n=1 Tax=Desulfuromonas versatilis TaxID=2802975 RepID=A0ABM8HSM5_9BACT|nr:DUF4112 domain-containing protein [Desulfuromonas versatilis]BCR03655.1 hypothetical protein DESUT3_07240 [Desulfuromonas versatilis]
MSKMDQDKIKKRLERLAWLLDNSIPIPGLNVRIGLDALIGLFPGYGDTIGALVSSYILSEAARLGAPKSVLLKMAANIALDTLVGAIPLFGDLFDFAWKANQRNVLLLGDYLENPRRAVASSRLFAGLLGLVLVAFVVFIGMLGFLLIRLLWQAASGA